MHYDFKKTEKKWQEYWENNKTFKTDIRDFSKPKYYALDIYCKENDLKHENIVYIGDDYGLGGNDESVYKSDFPYLTIDDYRDFPKIVKLLW